MKRTGMMVGLMMLLWSQMAAAQVKIGIIAGQVTDTAGVPIAKAIVRLTSETPRYDVSISTNDEGYYGVDNVPVGGPFTVSVRRLGYSPQSQTGVMVKEGKESPVDFFLVPLPTELPRVRTRRGNSSQTDPKISYDEIRANPSQNAFTILTVLRPGVLAMICGSTNEQTCRYNMCARRFGPMGPPPNDTSCRSLWEAAGRPNTTGFYGEVLNVGQCPLPDKVFVNGVRHDGASTPLYEVLEGIDGSLVDSVEYIDCWNYDVPERERNAIWVYRAPVLLREARQWVTLGIGFFFELTPMSENAQRRVSMRNSGALSLGVEFRLNDFFTGRVVASASIARGRTVDQLDNCYGGPPDGPSDGFCTQLHYAGGRLWTAGFDLVARGGREGLALGLGVGVRRYSLPSADEDPCVDCVAASLTSHNGFYLRPFIRYTVGLADGTTVEIGPYLSRYNGRTMVDFVAGVATIFPFKRIPLQRRGKQQIEEE